MARLFASVVTAVVLGLASPVTGEGQDRDHGRQLSHLDCCCECLDPEAYGKTDYYDDLEGQAKLDRCMEVADDTGGVQHYMAAECTSSDVYSHCAYGGRCHPSHYPHGHYPHGHNPHSHNPHSHIPSPEPPPSPAPSLPPAPPNHEYVIATEAKSVGDSLWPLGATAGMPAVTLTGDPHLHLAHGGVADFRGRNGSHYVLLSAPNVQVAGQTLAVDFLLPRPQLVHGSFFTNATCVVRGASNTVYTINTDANAAGFTVSDDKAAEPDAGYDVSIKKAWVGTWDQWSQDGVFAMYRQSTFVVRANGWEVNASRHPVYNYVSGPAKWRLDIAMRPLDGTTGLEAEHGMASKTCYPHGIIGQSWDGDDIAVDGATDDYTFKPEDPVITTKAMAEGAIEGKPADYELAAGEETGSFAYSRFDKTADAICAPRDVSKLAGKKTARAQSAAAAGSNDEPLAA